MKIKSLLMLMIASAALLFASCENENSTEELFSQEVTIQKGTTADLGQLKISFDGPCKLVIHDKWDGPTVYYNTYISNVGHVSGLSAISIIPGTGWVFEVEAVKGNGYVGRAEYWRATTRYAVEGDLVHTGQFYYTKMYVYDVVKDGSGNILAVKIKYSPMEL